MSWKDALFLVLPIMSFYWGYSSGHSDGVKEGRIAVRKYYEKVMNVR